MTRARSTEEFISKDKIIKMIQNTTLNQGFCLRVLQKENLKKKTNFLINDRSIDREAIRKNLNR